MDPYWQIQHFYCQYGSVLTNLAAVCAALEDLNVWNAVSSCQPENTLKTPDVKRFKLVCMWTVECPSFTAKQKSWDAGSLVNVDLCWCVEVPVAENSRLKTAKSRGGQTQTEQDYTFLSLLKIDYTPFSHSATPITFWHPFSLCSSDHFVKIWESIWNNFLLSCNT